MKVFIVVIYRLMPRLNIHSCSRNCSEISGLVNDEASLYVLIIGLRKRADLYNINPSNVHGCMIYCGTEMHI